MDRNHRVTNNLDFTRIIQRGSSQKTDALVLYYTYQSERFRLGIAVSKKVGNAVIRNKIKRQLRSIFRNKIDKYPKLEVIAVVRKNYLDYSYEEISALVDKMLNKTEINHS